MTGNTVYESFSERSPDFGVSLKNFGTFVKKNKFLVKKKVFPRNKKIKKNTGNAVYESLSETIFANIHPGYQTIPIQNIATSK